MVERVHILKTVATCWEAVASGEKRFEIRRNDRFFQSGDTVRLRKLRDDGLFDYDLRKGSYANNYLDLDFRIGWILQGGQLGVEPGYIVFQLEELPSPTP